MGTHYGAFTDEQVLIIEDLLNNSVVVLHKNASFRNLKIMTTKKL